MSKKILAKPLVTSDLLDAFEETCRTHLAFLLGEHGLEPGETERGGYEFAITFGSPTLRVVVAFEYPTPPWIVLEAAHNGRWKRAGLHQLAKRVGLALPGGEPKPEPTPSALLGSLQLDAKFLRANWHQLLDSLIG